MTKTKLWGGRFDKATNKLVEEFTNSIHFDKELAGYDCIGSLYHISVLKKAKLLNASEYKKLETGLNAVLTSVLNGSLKIDPSFEDIHSYIQHLVEQKAGKAALKLHTCRSRNDQVVFDTKMYCLVNAERTVYLLDKFIETLNGLAAKHAHTYIPGYTHLQHAIPVSLANYFEAYVQMFSRDKVRLSNARKNIKLSFGSGALAGTFIPASFYHVGTNLGAAQNSLDAVSSRDFVIEILSALAIVGMHLSRLAEDMVLWATKEFNFIDIDDAFCTGSSLMPQKKNPDVLELVRGYAGRLYGNLLSVLVMMKGLPLSYNRDMQLDKEPLFDSVKIVQNELAVLTELFKNVTFNKEKIAKQLNDEALYATDIADHLVQHGVPFKEAHATIGKLIQHKYRGGKEIQLCDLDDAALKKFHPLLTAKILRKLIDPKTSVASKRSVQKQRTK